MSSLADSRPSAPWRALASEELRALRLVRPSRDRLLLMAAVLAFCALFQLSYAGLVAPLFDYMGVIYAPKAGLISLLPWLLALLPTLWIPTRIRRTSHLTYWSLYVTVYLTSIFIAFDARTAGDADTLTLSLLLALAFALLGTVLEAPVLRLPRLRLSRSIVWVALWTFTAVCEFYVFWRFRGGIRLVGLESIYEQRFAAAAYQGGLVSYLGTWLANAVHPFLMAWGLERRRPVVFLLGAAGQVFLYATEATKMILLSVPLVLLLWWVLRSHGRHFGTLVCLGASAIILGAWFVQGASDYAGPLVGVLVLRLFWAQGLTTSQYAAFFAHHPQTYLSHLHLVRSFVHYPYDAPVPFVVGEYFSGNPTYDANAHFWAGDGLAGFGLIGILVITPLAMLTLWLMDSAPRKGNERLMALSSVVQIAGLANGSIFSALIGGGIWLNLLLLWLEPQPPERAPAPSFRVRLLPRLPFRFFPVSRRP